MRKDKAIALATKRVEILWVFYEKHGKILCADVLALTGKRASNLYATFEMHGIKAPPVWDTKAAIKKRTIAALWAKANELDKKWLSVEEVTAALAINEKNVYSLRTRYGSHIPEIRNKKRISPSPTKALPKLPPQLDNDTGEGLKVWRSRPGPKPGQVIYVLK